MRYSEGGVGFTHGLWQHLSIEYTARQYSLSSEVKHTHYGSNRSSPDDGNVWNLMFHHCYIFTSCKVIWHLKSLFYHPHYASSFQKLCNHLYCTGAVMFWVHSKVLQSLSLLWKNEVILLPSFWRLQRDQRIIRGKKNSPKEMNGGRKERRRTIRKDGHWWKELRNGIIKERPWKDGSKKGHWKEGRIEGKKGIDRKDEEYRKGRKGFVCRDWRKDIRKTEGHWKERRTLTGREKEHWKEGRNWKKVRNDTEKDIRNDSEMKKLWKDTGMMG